VAKALDPVTERLLFLQANIVTDGIWMYMAFDVSQNFTHEMLGEQFIAQRFFPGSLCSVFA